MEAVATEDLWIWHAFIGIPGSNNDINVLDRSPLLPEWFSSPAVGADYKLNGIDYKGCYLLADGIYPDALLFVKTLPNPQSAKLKHFAARQEAVQDVERCSAFEKVVSVILSIPCRLWDVKVMKNVSDLRGCHHAQHDIRRQRADDGNLAAIKTRLQKKITLAT